MKATMERKHLKEALKRISKIATGKHSIDALNHVLIQGANGTLLIMANDYSRTAINSIEYEGDDFVLCVRAEKLTRAVNSMKDGEVSIVQDATTTKIKQSRSAIKLQTMDAKTWPAPEHEDMKLAGASSSDLNNTIKRVKHASAKDDVRPYLNGIYLTDGWCVASDGHRMARSKCDYDGTNLIIPNDSIGHLDGIDGHVYYNDREVMIKGQNESASSRLIDSKYPDFQRLYQFGDGQSFEANKQDFLDALSQVEVGGEYCTLESQNDELIISNSEANTTIATKGKAEKVSLQISYLKDVLSVIGDTAYVFVESQSGKTIINDNFIIMPRRV